MCIHVPLYYTVTIEQTPKIVNILDPSPTFVGPPDQSQYPSVGMYNYVCELTRVAGLQVFEILLVLQRLRVLGWELTLLLLLFLLLHLFFGLL